MMRLISEHLILQCDENLGFDTEKHRNLMRKYFLANSEKLNTVSIDFNIKYYSQELLFRGSHGRVDNTHICPRSIKNIKNRN